MNIIQITYNITKLLGLSAILAILCVSQVSAKDYKVEVLLFENLSGAKATENHHYTPPNEMRSSSSTWDIQPSMLLDSAEKISDSPDYTLLNHYSWGQESLPYSDSASYQLFGNKTLGWIRVYADQLLFANLDIDFDGYRLTEKRRLKLNEKHYFDHPKFGVLIQVSRLEQETPDKK